MSRTSSPRPATAWGAALRLLARRDLSEGEVRTKLLARDFYEPEVEAAISRLRERRYLDDRLLAEAVARTQSRTKHQGPLKVRAHMQRRRIPEHLALEAIRTEFPDGAEGERAVIALHRLQPAPSALDERDPDGAAPSAGRRKEAARLFRRLVARGYSREAARHAVLTGGRSLEPEHDPELGT